MLHVAQYRQKYTMYYFIIVIILQRFETNIPTIPMIAVLAEENGSFRTTCLEIVKLDEESLTYYM